jgi:hypothetical protein
MDIHEIADYIRREQFISDVRGTYQGFSCVSAVHSPNGDGGFAAVLYIEDIDTSGFRETVRVGDQDWPVIVRGGYRRPGR